MKVRLKPPIEATFFGRSPSGFFSLAAWIFCAVCALLGGLIYSLDPSSPSVEGISTAQMGVWLTMMLLLGLSIIASVPRLFSVLLVVLIMSLFGLAPASVLLAGALTDAALWWLGAFSLSVAARHSGLLGVLVARAIRSLQAPRVNGGYRMPAVLWLGMAFALLPSPAQVSVWAHSVCPSFCSVSPQGSRDVISAAQLAARLAWLPAHPANLLLLALLPAGGLDRFVPLQWALSTWPLLILTVTFATYTQWRLQRKNVLSDPLSKPSQHQNENRFPLHCTAAAATVLALLVALQPFHGFAPGLLSVMVMVALFALKAVTPKTFHGGVDWALFTAVMVLPGMMVSFAASLPPWNLLDSAMYLALPFVFLLRWVAPKGVDVITALVLTLSWSTAHGHDLLDTAVPVLVAIHCVDFMLMRHPGSQGAAARLSRGWTALKSPVTWSACAVYYVWLWWGGR